MKFLFILISIIVYSCQSQTSESKENDQIDKSLVDSVERSNHDSDIHGSEKAMSFLDSVAGRHELSINQIKTRTSIDSLYYTDIFSNAVFTGDTVLNLNETFKGAIITYDDKQSCIYKFLIVVNPDNKGMDNKIIYSDCDQDMSTNFSTIRYRFLSDSSFETIETSFQVIEKKSNIDAIKWEINRLGRIVPFR